MSTQFGLFLRQTASAIRRRFALLGGIAAAQVIGMIGLAAGTRLVTEVVAPDVYGVYKLAVGVAAFAHGLIAMPLVHYAMRGVHDAQRNQTTLRFIGAARRSLIATSLAAGTVMVAGSFVAWLLGSPGWLVLSAVAVGVHLTFESKFSLESALTTSMGKPGLAAVYAAAKSIAIPLTMAGAAMVLADSVTVLVAANGLVIGGLALRLRGQHEGSPGMPVSQWIRSARTFAVPLVPVAILSWMFSVGDRYLLAWLTDIGTVGRYAAVYGLIATPLGVVGGLIPSLSYQPLFKSASLERTDATRSIIRRALVYQLVLVGAAVTVVIILAPIGINLFLAESYRAGGLELVPWIAIGQGILVAAFALDLAAYSEKRTSRLTISYGVAVVVNLVANLVLIPLNGAVGAAQATALAGVAYFVTMWYLAHPRGAKIARTHRRST